MSFNRNQSNVLANENRIGGHSLRNRATIKNPTNNAANEALVNNVLTNVNGSDRVPLGHLTNISRKDTTGKGLLKKNKPLQTRHNQQLQKQQLQQQQELQQQELLQQQQQEEEQQKLFQQQQLLQQEQLAVVQAESMEIDDDDIITDAPISYADSIVDIDILDKDYPEYCHEYVKDIYEYLHTVQLKHKVEQNYMDNVQTDISPRMRSILIDWLVDVHIRFKLMQETLYLTVSIIDRFLSIQNISRRKLQLVGVAGMLIASKFEEIYAPEVNDFVYVTDDAYSREEILEMERIMLNVLEFRVATAYPLHFLRRASKVADADPRTHTLAKYLMELSLPSQDMLQYLPAKVAASALCLARMMLLCGEWNETIAVYTKYEEVEIRDCVNAIFELAKNAKDSPFKAIYTKYSNKRFHSVSLLADSQISNAQYQ